MEREVMEYDVVIVGGGPSGLSAAIKLAQLAKENDKPLEICLLEKGSEIGAHILSGNVFQPTGKHAEKQTYQTLFCYQSAAIFS